MFVSVDAFKKMLPHSPELLFKYILNLLLLQCTVVG